MFARTSVIIFVVVMICTLSVTISFIAQNSTIEVRNICHACMRKFDPFFNRVNLY